METYIIIGSDRMGYKSSYLMYLTSTTHLDVDGTEDYNKARKYHSLKWATHRARFLTKRTPRAYYVYHRIKVDGKTYYHLVDEHINDAIFEKEDKISKEIDELISQWKKEKNLQ